MSLYAQKFRARCHACMRAGRVGDIHIVKRTPSGVYRLCMTCGKKSYSQSRASRRAKDVEEKKWHWFLPGKEDAKMVKKYVAYLRKKYNLNK